MSRVTLRFENTDASNQNLTWAILHGTCGNPPNPVLPLTVFPLIDMGGSGHGEVSAQLPFTFPTSGTYHVEISIRASGSPEDIIGCSNLKQERVGS